MPNKHRWHASVVGLLVSALFCASVRAQSPFPPGDEPPALNTPQKSSTSESTDDEDVVEQITPAADTPAEEAVTKAAGNGSLDTEKHFSASGYVRQSLELAYGELLRQQKDAASPLLWRDVFVSRTQLALRGSYLQGKHFEATVSGMLGYTLHVAGEAPQYRPGVVSLQRGELDPELRDAYLGFYWPSVELRIGQQRVAWGRADFQSPNDVINARDMRDPFLEEPELRHLPTPVARLDLSDGVVTLEGVVSPLFIPDRFDVYGSNWSAIQRRAPGVYQAFLGNVSDLVDPSVERDLASLLRQTELPPAAGPGASAGAKLSIAAPGVDIDAYYHYGFDSLPFVSADPQFSTYLNTTDFATQAAANLSPLLDLMDAGIKPLTVRYVRRHHVGVDLATSAGPLMLRLDGAYENRRVFYTPDLTSIESPTLLGVVSLEYQTGSLDEIFLVEFMAAHLLDRVPGPLLGYDRTSAAVAATFRWPFGRGWGVDLRGIVGIVPKTYVLQPALRYAANDSFSIEAGALLLSGEANSFGWYFGDNDSAFVQFRYAF
jgi:hypothetical protein